MKKLNSVIVVLALTLNSTIAISATCTKTTQISPGYWVGCPDACQWVPPKYITVQYEC